MPLAEIQIQVGFTKTAVIRRNLKLLTWIFFCSSESMYPQGTVVILTLSALRDDSNRGGSKSPPPIRSEQNIYPVEIELRVLKGGWRIQTSIAYSTVYVSCTNLLKEFFNISVSVVRKLINDFSFGVWNFRIMNLKQRKHVGYST